MFVLQLLAINYLFPLSQNYKVEFDGRKQTKKNPYQGYYLYGLTLAGGYQAAKSVAFFAIVTYETGSASASSVTEENDIAEITNSFPTSQKLKLNSVTTGLGIQFQI